ncbi:MAG: TlyA family RNA methyltransferase [Clostridia bacterium]|nr:TlyA family RNA methyltransferase [Clostridia bacterium]
MRLDIALTERGLVTTRTRAKAAILEGAVKVGGKIADKPSLEVSADDVIELVPSSALRYVSRGGLKLEAALSAFPVSTCDRVAIDIGASSGGFTDCLLQNGAKKVYAVDSGSGQLAQHLRTDPRVFSIENTNARYLDRSLFADVTLAVMDVSFISQTMILPAIADILPSGGELISLIKPQFEVGRAHIGKGGIVRKESARKEAIDRVKDAATLLGLSFQGIIESPICGGDGNVEYLAYFRKDSL